MAHGTAYAAAVRVVVLAALAIASVGACSSQRDVQDASADDDVACTPASGKQCSQGGGSCEQAVNGFSCPPGKQHAVIDDCRGTCEGPNTMCCVTIAALDAATDGSSESTSDGATDTGRDP